LDHILERLGARWITDGAFRGRMSIGCGASAAIALCMLVAIVAAVVNGTFGGPGLHNSPTGLPGGPQLQGAAIFPTATVAPWAPDVIPPANPVPASQTPIPEPTAIASPTPMWTDGSPTPTGGTGELPTTCNGQVGSTTWGLAPCPQQAGRSGNMTINAPGYANAPINVLVSFGVCAGNASCTYTFLPSQYHLNASGSITLNYTVPAAAGNNTAPVSGMVNIQNGPSFTFAAAPVH
jgi:hypothetical protein